MVNLGILSISFQLDKITVSYSDGSTVDFVKAPSSVWQQSQEVKKDVSKKNESYTTPEKLQAARERAAKARAAKAAKKAEREKKEAQAKVESETNKTSVTLSNEQFQELLKNIKLSN